MENSKIVLIKNSECYDYGLERSCRNCLFFPGRCRAFQGRTDGIETLDRGRCGCTKYKEVRYETKND